jgi:hypothetical protein
MSGFNPDLPPGIALVADHLDAVLAIGEDLIAERLPPRADLDELDADGAPYALDRFVRELRQREAALLLRLLQCRRLLVDIGSGGRTFKSAAALFRAQTDALSDLIAKATREEARAIPAPVDSLSYLRSRSVIAPEAAQLSPFEAAGATEAFRVGGVAPLGAIMDMVAALLDLMDSHFDLYGDDDDLGGEIAHAQPVPSRAIDAKITSPGETAQAVDIVSEGRPISVSEAIIVDDGGSAALDGTPVPGPAL